MFLLSPPGARVNALMNHKTPLHLVAMKSRDVGVAELLITYGANVYLRNRWVSG